MSVPLHVEGVSIWCEKHWARVKADGKLSGTTATLALLAAGLKSDSLVQKAKLVVGMTDEQEGEAISDAIAECSPICCWIAPEMLDGVYAEARAGGNGR